MAPEFLEHRIFTEQSDIYSFGILMFEVFRPYNEAKGNTSIVQAAVSPYPDLQLVQISYQVVNEGLRPNVDVLKDAFNNNQENLTKINGDNISMLKSKYE